MLPKLLPTQVFPRPYTQYTAHLGEYQATASTALWNLNDDSKTNAVNAAQHIHPALDAPAGDRSMKLAPLDLRVELRAGVGQVESMYAARIAKGPDVEYISLLSIVAAWSHEFVGKNIDAFDLDANG